MIGVRIQTRTCKQQSVVGHDKCSAVPFECEVVGDEIEHLLLCKGEAKERPNDRQLVQSHEQIRQHGGERILVGGHVAGFRSRFHHLTQHIIGFEPDRQPQLAKVAPGWLHNKQKSDTRV